MPGACIVTPDLQIFQPQAPSLVVSSPSAGLNIGGHWIEGNRTVIGPVVGFQENDLQTACCFPSPQWGLPTALHLVDVPADKAFLMTSDFAVNCIEVWSAQAQQKEEIDENARNFNKAVMQAFGFTMHSCQDAG
eukprot:TRINITY_DN62176_c0_g1_i2.p2 TRINITY_DN62176_c0_g1~~TRINITY_DN62176_c0_g1_i2.p2  ORF type:complete len:134 (+),score=22.30 TRINITY_DN62176_c0_g1_i2:803-1204(+)